MMCTIHLTHRKSLSAAGNLPRSLQHKLRPLLSSVTNGDFWGIDKMDNVTRELRVHVQVVDMWNNIPFQSDFSSKVARLSTWMCNQYLIFLKHVHKLMSDRQTSTTVLNQVISTEYEGGQIHLNVVTVA